SGTVTIGSSSFNPGSNGSQFSGTLTLNRDVILDGSSTDRTSFTGKITGSGNIAIANGRVTIRNAANDFLGNVTVNPGARLQTDRAEVIPDTSDVTVNGDMVFTLGGAETINALNGSGNVSIL